MPELVLYKYLLGGWARSVIFSEEEMSGILEIDRRELREAIDAGKIYYSIHPKAQFRGEYEFTEAIAVYNVKLWKCLQSGGHFFEISGHYDEETKKKQYKCKSCPAVRYEL